MTHSPTDWIYPAPRDPYDGARDVEAFKAWDDARPRKVRALAAEFPRGSVVLLDEKFYFVTDYTEDDVLIVAPTWMGDDHAKSKLGRRHLDAKHVRNDRVPIWFYKDERPEAHGNDPVDTWVGISRTVN